MNLANRRASRSLPVAGGLAPGKVGGAFASAVSLVSLTAMISLIATLPGCPKLKIHVENR
jgi:hypothetical protein